jgi:hypothetical protein
MLRVADATTTNSGELWKRRTNFLRAVQELRFVQELITQLLTSCINAIALKVTEQNKLYDWLCSLEELIVGSGAPAAQAIEALKFSEIERVRTFPDPKERMPVLQIIEEAINCDFRDLQEPLQKHIDRVESTSKAVQKKALEAVHKIETAEINIQYAVKAIKNTEEKLKVAQARKIEALAEETELWNFWQAMHVDCGSE